MLDKIEMRDVYCNSLVELAKTDKDICVLEADLMKSTGTAKFFEAYPERSFDVGIAEANMVGIGAGLATAGKKPFCASFSAFVTRRCYDQICISVAYTKLNVKLVGTDPSIMAEINGGTHMSMEDVAIMRAMPNMTVFEPIDATMLQKAMPFIAGHNGPMYIRLFRKKAEQVFGDDYNFDFYKATKLKNGKSVTIIASGIMVAKALTVAKTLAGEGIDAGVLAIHTLKPIDEKAIIEAAKESGAIVCAENHSVIGGLGSAVCDVLGQNIPTPIKLVGVNDHFGEVGKADFLAEKFKLTESDIIAACKQVIKMKNRKA